nr:hypothetical protein CFP56_35592 [Quercus suber]
MEAVDSRKRKFDEMEEQQAIDEAEQLSYPLSVIYPQLYPWLVISQGEDLQNQTFVDVCHPVVDSQYFSNISESQCFTCSILEMHKKFVCATRNQWLILKDESMFVSLLNLITQEVVPLLMMEHCHISNICLLLQRRLIPLMIVTYFSFAVRHLNSSIVSLEIENSRNNCLSLSE